MDLNDKIIIKVQFQDEIRKMPIHNEEITYDELLLMMGRVFKNKINTNDEITIKYKDEDGDLITLADDSDLAFALGTSNILKLILTNEEDEIEEKSGKNLNAREILTIRKELQSIRDNINRLLDGIVNVNGETVLNSNLERTDVTIQEVGGKEFDPLSTNNQLHSRSVERTESAASLNSRNGELVNKPQPNFNEENRDLNEVNKSGSINSMPPKNQSSGIPQFSQANHVNQGMPPISNVPPMQNSMYHQQQNQNIANPQTHFQPSMPPTSQPRVMQQPNMSNSPVPQTNPTGQNYQQQTQHQNDNQKPGFGAPPQRFGPGYQIPQTQHSSATPPPPQMQPNLNMNMPPRQMQPGYAPPTSSAVGPMPPNMSSNMPPNMSSNMPPNMSSNMPPNMSSNMPPNMSSNMPPNMSSNMPPNMSHNMPPNMSSNMPPPQMRQQSPSTGYFNPNQQFNPSQNNPYSNFHPVQNK